MATFNVNIQSVNYNYDDNTPVKVGTVTLNSETKDLFFCSFAIPFVSSQNIINVSLGFLNIQRIYKTECMLEYAGVNEFVPDRNHGVNFSGFQFVVNPTSGNFPADGVLYFSIYFTTL